MIRSFAQVTAVKSVGLLLLCLTLFCQPQRAKGQRTNDPSGAGAVDSIHTGTRSEGNESSANGLPADVVIFIGDTLIGNVENSPEKLTPISQKELAVLIEQANSGDAKAQSELAGRYALGMGVAQDLDEFGKWLIKAAASGEPRAETLLGGLLLEWSARVGNLPPPLQGMVAASVAEGDKAPGLRWLTKAAESGDATAAYDLGRNYNGEIRGGVVKDDAESFRWFLKAAQAGLAEAQTSVGIAYATGKGTAKDVPTALEWLEKAASLGESRAMSALGQLYSDGNEIPRNSEKAMIWFLRAALLYNLEAQADLGVCYLGGMGVPMDIQEGKDLLENSAMAGNALAADYLSHYYLTIAPDNQKAYAWLGRGAAQGLPENEAEFGLMIRRGLGVSNDPVEAMKWFDLAADRGWKKAVIYRDDFSVLLNPDERQEARRRADAFKPQTIKGGIDPHFEVKVSIGDKSEIPVLLFGQTNYMVVDTGSSASFLDLPFESRLGKSVGIGTMPMWISTATNLPIYRCPGVEIGGGRFAPLWARCIDFERARTSSGGPCDGVLGMDLWKGYAFTFNMDDASFSVSQFVPEEKKKRAMAIPMSDTGITYAPGMDGSANGKVIRFVLDSGGDGTVSLIPSDWQRVFPSGASKTSWVEVGDLKSRGKTMAARLARLQIGTNIYTNLIVTLDLGHQSRLCRGFIGRHILTVDYPNEIIYLQPAKGYSEPDEWNMSGMHLERKGQKTRVDFIDETSTAFKAGVKENDEILSLNGQPAASLKLGAIRKMLTSKPGDKIRVEVDRNGKKTEFSFELERVI